jgi:hypothetical protein
LSDEEFATVRISAAPIMPRLRSRFLEPVASELGRQPIIGPANVAKVCASLQQRYLNGEMDKRPAMRYGGRIRAVDSPTVRSKRRA